MIYKQGKFFGFNKAFVTAYEGEPEGEGGTATPTPETKAGSNDNLLTQEQVNKIVQERIGREKKVQDELLAKLTDLQNRASMSDEERSKLTKRIDELRNENLSVEEKLNREVKQWSEKYQTETETLKREVTDWREKHFSYQVERELMDAALANDARVPSQLVQLLKSNTQMKEVLNEKGQPTGRYEVKVTIHDQKEDGTPFTMELSPSEAVAKLREMPDKWGNQFSARSKDGSGLGNDLMSPVQTTKYNGLVVDKDFDTYMKSRDTEAGKSQLGLNRPNFRR